jgi:DNA mismatch endonuclease (patch repair protein)
MPKTKLDFWGPKLEKNVIRDAKVHRELRKLEWQTLTVWECQLKTPDVVQTRIRRFLEA